MSYVTKAVTWYTQAVQSNATETYINASPYPIRSAAIIIIIK
jgi:hypothetical protein